MREIELEGSNKVVISKWKREGEDDTKGVKVSISDSKTMATLFLSLKDLEKFLVALYKERDEVLKDIKK